MNVSHFLIYKLTQLKKLDRGLRDGSALKSTYSRDPELNFQLTHQMVHNACNPSTREADFSDLGRHLHIPIHRHIYM